MCVYGWECRSSGFCVRKPFRMDHIYCRMTIYTARMRTGVRGRKKGAGARRAETLNAEYFICRFNDIHDALAHTMHQPTNQPATHCRHTHTHFWYRPDMAFNDHDLHLVTDFISGWRCYHRRRRRRFVVCAWHTQCARARRNPDNGRAHEMRTHKSKAKEKNIDLKMVISSAFHQIHTHTHTQLSQRVCR